MDGPRLMSGRPLAHQFSKKHITQPKPIWWCLIQCLKFWIWEIGLREEANGGGICYSTMRTFVVRQRQMGTFCRVHIVGPIPKSKLGHLHYLKILNGAFVLWLPKLQDRKWVGRIYIKLLKIIHLSYKRRREGIISRLGC